MKKQILTAKQANLVLWVLNGYSPPQETAKFLHAMVDGPSDVQLINKAYENLQKIARG